MLPESWPLTLWSLGLAPLLPSRSPGLTKAPNPLSPPSLSIRAQSQAYCGGGDRGCAATSAAQSSVIIPILLYLTTTAGEASSSSARR